MRHVDPFRRHIPHRRHVLRLFGGLSLAPVAALTACSDTGELLDSETDTDTGATTDTSTDSSDMTGTTDSTTDAVTEVTTDTDSGTLAWASGGTDRISVDFPDNSLFDAGGTCNVSLTPTTTLGPCYFEDSSGEDISEGLTGLPMQLCLRLIDSACAPLAGYTVEVWHCDTRGVYSGDTTASLDAGSFAGGFCTANDSAAEQSTWFRGKLDTDASGRVNFRTCFPGWYRGRTIHIHFKVSDPSGATEVISQFCFTDELAREICTTHGLYSDRGEQDTTLAGGRDTVFPSSDNEVYILDTQQNSDGTLLAWHSIQIG